MRPSNTAWNAKDGQQHRPNRPGSELTSVCAGQPGVEPPAGIEPATPSLPWNHQEPLCGWSFSQVALDRRGRRYRFSFGEVMRSLRGCLRVAQGAGRAPGASARPAWRRRGRGGSPPYGRRCGSRRPIALAVRPSTAKATTWSPGRSVTRRRTRRDLARVVDVPWDIAVGGDLVFPASGDAARGRSGWSTLTSPGSTPPPTT
jgi:hypothetical protein